MCQCQFRRGTEKGGWHVWRIEGVPVYIKSDYCHDVEVNVLTLSHNTYEPRVDVEGQATDVVNWEKCILRLPVHVRTPLPGVVAHQG